MSRRPVNKVIHYVRAIYNAGTAPKKNFEQLVRQAMNKLGRMDETDIGMATLGTVSIRHRETTTGTPLLLAIGAGVPGEQMSTIGIKIATLHDSDQSTSPPINRAFKHADAFVLIDENDVLLITDGPFRNNTVATYLRELFSKADLKSETAAFEFRRVTNRDTQEVLDREGIKELRLKTTMYQASNVLDPRGSNSSVKGKLKSFVGAMRNAFSEDVDDNQLEQLSGHWGEMQVNTVISAKGGSRAEEIVLEVMQSVGKDVLEEDEEGVDVTVVTQKGTKVRLNEASPTKFVRLLRRDGANDLINTEVYEQLAVFRNELQTKRQWKN
ncbi:hypothetical protein D3C77_268370 [compost metagenome]